MKTWKSIFTTKGRLPDLKKALAFVLMICLAAACVPAGALPADTRGITAMPYVLDLSKGTVRFQSPDTSSTEEFYQTECGAVYLFFDGALELGRITRVEANYLHDMDIIKFDLDGDGSADFCATFYYDDNHYKTHIEYDALEEASCSPVYQISITKEELIAAVGEPSYDVTWLCPVTIIFPHGALSDSAGKYDINEDGGLTFTAPAKSGASSVKIPDAATLGKAALPVTKIADNAFKNQKKLTKVTIGKNVKEIGKNAFAKCVKLKTVSGGANLEIIGDSAFSGCKALTRFTIGAKVKSIGKKAFYKCAALKKLTIKTKLLTAQTVGSGAFKGINASATIKVPKAVKKEYTKWLLKKGVKKTMKIK